MVPRCSYEQTSAFKCKNRKYYIHRPFESQVYIASMYQANYSYKFLEYYF